MKLLYKLVEVVNKVETAYRRIDFPEVKKRDLVIDIGSGGMPNPRADFACDFIDEDEERSDFLKIDRPFVWANAENLPFKNKVFKYSILSHVLEHVENPSKVLDEVQRISSGGYIETPNSFYEFAVSHVYHVSRCTVIDNKLTVTFKEQWDERLGGDRQDIDHDANKCWWDLHNLNARALLTMYKWRDKINYVVVGEKPFKKQKLEKSEGTKRSFSRDLVIRFIYWFLKPRKKIILDDILVCPRCGGGYS